MAEGKDVIWVRTSADIPRNDFLNYTPSELRQRFPKVPVEDILLQRHIFFPRRFPLPVGVNKETLKYRQNLILKGPQDLKDSIFAELPVEEIMRRFPQFSAVELAREKAVRDVRVLAKRIKASMGRRDLKTKDAVLGDIAKSKVSLSLARPLSDEMRGQEAWLAEVEGNVINW